MIITERVCETFTNRNATAGDVSICEPEQVEVGQFFVRTVGIDDQVIAIDESCSSYQCVLNK